MDMYTIISSMQFQVLNLSAITLKYWSFIPCIHNVYDYLSLVSIMFITTYPLYPKCLWLFIPRIHNVYDYLSLVSIMFMTIYPLYP
jgi:hypothetical protein